MGRGTSGIRSVLELVIDQHSKNLRLMGGGVKSAIGRQIIQDLADLIISVSTDIKAFGNTVSAVLR